MAKRRRTYRCAHRTRSASPDDLVRDLQIGLGKAVLAGNHDHFEALQMLAKALTRAGRFREALDVDHQILRLRPEDPLSYYNLACSYSNVRDLDHAFASLETALSLGYRDMIHLLHDTDLKNVRRDPRFRSLIEKRWGRRQSRKRE